MPSRGASEQIATTTLLNTVTTTIDGDTETDYYDDFSNLFLHKLKPTEGYLRELQAQNRERAICRPQHQPRTTAADTEPGRTFLSTKSAPAPAPSKPSTPRASATTTVSVPVPVPVLALTTATETAVATALSTVPAPSSTPAPLTPAPSISAANFPPLLHTTLYIPSPPTTDNAISSSPTLSPRALQKQPVRDAFLSHSALTASPDLPSAEFGSSHQTAVIDPDPPILTLADPHSQQLQRRSFLEALLVRQKRIIAPDNRSATSRVLNPINYVPRPTPVRVQQQPHHQRQLSSIDAATGEVRTLLNLPEQRRSRQHSPKDLTVEHSPHLAPQAGDRTSIPLPINQQRRTVSDFPLPAAEHMTDSEKNNSNGLHEPERAHLAQGHNPRGRDTETQQTSSVLGQGYGVSPLDQPLHPPRRITSHRSLNRAQSGLSLRSSAYARTNTDGNPPVASSHDDDQRPYTGEDDESVAEELAWGPSHPCFPHLNPHVPLDSPEYSATRIIRIRRDWMVAGDLAPTFSNIYPEILDPLMQEQEFRYVIEHINHTLCTAYDPFSTWNWLDGFLGLVTGWFWEDFRPLGVKGQLRALEEWLEDWNHTVGARDGVKIISLRRTGYLNFDIQIPDPQVTMVAERDGDSQAPPNPAEKKGTTPGIDTLQTP